MVREKDGDLLGMVGVGVQIAMVGVGVQIATRIKFVRVRRRGKRPFADPPAEDRIVETYDVRAGNDRPIRP
jgi:hypothetical protein